MFTFLNKTESYKRLVLYTSSSESESESSTGMPSLAGLVTKPKSQKGTRKISISDMAKICRNSGKQYAIKKRKVCEGKVFQIFHVTVE